MHMEMMSERSIVRINVCVALPGLCFQDLLCFMLTGSRPHKCTIEFRV